MGYSRLDYSRHKHNSVCNLLEYEVNKKADAGYPNDWEPAVEDSVIVYSICCGFYSSFFKISSLRYKCNPTLYFASFYKNRKFVLIIFFLLYSFIRLREKNMSKLLSCNLLN